MAAGIARTLHGHGNVLMVEGIAGEPITEQEDQGGLAAFHKYPGIKIVGQVNGNWTPSITQSVVLNVLTTNSAPINGVWTTGSESKEVAADFAQVHRPLPVISASISGDALGYWHQHQTTFKFDGGAVLPDWTSQTAFRIAVRLLEGQHPKLDTLMVPIPPVTQASLHGWYASCMTPSSASIFPTSQTDPLPESLMNGYFTNGHATPEYSFRSMPKACQ
jgi:ribose transport system substrate-binding protein